VKGSCFPGMRHLIFLTAALISAISIALVLILKRKMTQSQSTLKLEVEAYTKKRDAGGKEIGNDD
jgi:hypothetical protein